MLLFTYLKLTVKLYFPAVGCGSVWAVGETVLVKLSSAKTNTAMIIHLLVYFASIGDR
jgi:hypothetical protein